MRLLEEFLTRFPKAGVGETGLDKCRRGIPGMKMQKTRCAAIWIWPRG